MEGFEHGALVIVNLVSPKEKFWGTVLSLSQVGVTFRGISLESFPDWVRQMGSRSAEPTLDLATMFVPLFRVEKIFLDEPVGSVKSYADYFEEVVGIRPEQFLGLVDPNDNQGVH